MGAGAFFKQRFDHLQIAGGHCVFAKLERRCGLFPPGLPATNDEET
jgi:hypothetical protein